MLQVVEDDAFPLAIDQIERRFNRATWPVAGGRNSVVSWELFQ